MPFLTLADPDRFQKLCLKPFGLSRTLHWTSKSMSKSIKKLSRGIPGLTLQRAIQAILPRLQLPQDSTVSEFHQTCPCDLHLHEDCLLWFKLRLFSPGHEIMGSLQQLALLREVQISHCIGPVWPWRYVPALRTVMGSVRPIE